MVYVLIFIAALLLVGMSQKPRTEHQKPAVLGDFKFPRADYGDPIPMVWGTVKQSGPIISWYGDLIQFPVYTRVKAGIFKKKSVLTGYQYYLTIDTVLALGSNVILRTMWAGNKPFWFGALSTNYTFSVDWSYFYGGPDENGGIGGMMTFYTGNFDEIPDSWLQMRLSPLVPAYNGISRLVFKNFYLGNSPNVEAFHFEISRYSNSLNSIYSIMPNGLDVNPIEIAYDILVNDWGGAGNSGDIFDKESFIEASRIMYSENLGMSMLVQNVITTKDVIDEVLRVADGVIYQDPQTSKIKIKLIRNNYVVGSLRTYSEDSVVSVSDFQKTTWDSTYNQCRITFTNRAGGYDTSVAVASDFANINFQNQIKTLELNCPGIMDSYVASVVASRQLASLSVPLFKCTIEFNREAFELRPADLFVFSWKPYNIVRMVMRVVSIDFGTLTDNTIKVTCLQDSFASSDVVIAPPSNPEFVPPSSTPEVITEFVNFNPPIILSATEDENLSMFDTHTRIACLVRTPSSASHQFNFLALDSDGDWNNLETLQYVPCGILEDDYDIQSDVLDYIDDSKTLIINGLNERIISRLLNSESVDDARNKNTMLLINNELLCFSGFVKLSETSIQIKTAYRNLLDTVATNHKKGSKVWFISNIDQVVEDFFKIEEVAVFKLLDRTSSGTLDPDNIASQNYRNTNRASLPLPPQNIMINNSQDKSATINLEEFVKISWNNRSRFDNVFRFYSDSSDEIEENQLTKLEWKIGNSGFKTVNNISSNTYNLDIKGKTGLLEIRLYATVGNKASRVYSSMFANLTNIEPEDDESEE